MWRFPDRDVDQLTGHHRTQYHGCTDPWHHDKRVFPDPSETGLACEALVKSSIGVGNGRAPEPAAPKDPNHPVEHLGKSVIAALSGIGSDFKLSLAIARSRIGHCDHNSPLGKREPLLHLGSSPWAAKGKLSATRLPLSNGECCASPVKVLGMNREAARRCNAAPLKKLLYLGTRTCTGGHG